MTKLISMRPIPQRAFLLSTLVMAAIGNGPPALASDKGIAASPPQTNAEAVTEYCLNIRDKAAEARAARQAEAMKVMEARLEEKIKALEARRDEVKSWVERQTALRTAAEAGLVEIYATMEPESAARQMATLDARLASSVLAQLKPRIASAILNEMKPEKAVLLVKSLAAASGDGQQK